MPTPESAGTSDAVTAVPITPSESVGTDDAFTATCIPHLLNLQELMK